MLPRVDGDPTETTGSPVMGSCSVAQAASHPERPFAVPAPPTVDELDDRLLDELYDPGSLARGRAYAEEDRVKLLRSEPGTITAVCRGSGQTTYVVRIGWSRSGHSVALDDECTCPLGGACKHCVAAILSARRQATPPPASVGGSHLATDWRRALADLATVGDDDGDTSAAGLALQIVVVHPTPSRFVTSTGPRVTIRPMRMGKGGKWIKTGASWRDVTSPYGYSLTDVDPLQRAAVKSLVASGPPDLFYSNPQTAPLARFGPDLWYQLERAVEVGVDLIGEHAGDVIVVSANRAVPSVDLSADETGNVTLSASFTLDGEPVLLSEGRSGFIGAPPHGLWIRDGGRVDLIAFAAPLHQTVARLSTTDALTVPAGDVEEFLDIYQPALARHARVNSSDSSVTITTSRFDGIVAIVERTALDAATLRWSARYRRGERVIDHPLHGHSGRNRDRAAEAVAVSELELPIHLLPALVDLNGSPCDLTVSGPAIVTLLTEVIPWLEANGGVEIELVGDHPVLREAVEDPLISLVVTDGDDRRGGNDWFDLDVEVSVDGQIVDFVSLFAALDRDDEAIILPSGTWLRLDRPEFAKLRDLIEEARGLAEPSGSGVARLNRFQTSWWDELAGLGVVTQQSRRWADSVSRMAALAAPEPVALPAGLDATLRPYQQEGLDWLAFLHRNRLGGILADDMGLGKTVQALALCLHVLQDEPDARFLVVAPTSVVENWARETARFAPGIEVRTIGETAARRGHSLDEEIDGATIVVTSYALFRIEFDDYDRHDWDLLLLDEAQFVKNHQGKTYQCVRRLDAATKIAITGTPLENTLMDLWSLLSITAPGLYPDPQRFNKTYRKPIESGDAPELLTTLRRRIAPLLRRRTKDAVLTELPPKTEQTVEIELNPRHARIYGTQLQRQRQKVLGLVGDVQKHRFEILKSLTILRQLALDPGLVDQQHDNVGSSKLDRLLDDLTEVVAEGHRALVFSQFTRYLARVRTRLDAAGIAYSYLDGRTRKRGEAIARFKDGDTPVFVISLKAGGFGLNLTEADYCFILDPWWNPATESQAVDRTHRIGQENPVMVYRYVSTGTIEEKVMELKARKADLFNSVMDGEGAPRRSAHRGRHPRSPRSRLNTHPCSSTPTRGRLRRTGARVAGVRGGNMDSEFEILDVHHHVGNAFRALGGAVDSTPQMDEAEFEQLELRSRLEIMDRAQVQQAIVIPGHGYHRVRGIADTRAENDGIARYRDRTPDRFPGAVGIVEPRDGSASLAEIDRCKDELGLVGMSFHTRFQGVSLDSQWVLTYCARMAEVGLVPVIHAMNETPEEALWKLAVVARSIPDTPVLALDAFGSYEATRECFFIAEVAPNIVFDTSLSYNFDFTEEFAVRFGANRVVFGTDLYSYPVGRRISHLLDQIRRSALSDDDKAAILALNARRLFGVG